LKRSFLLIRSDGRRFKLRTRLFGDFNMKKFFALAAIASLLAAQAAQASIVDYRILINGTEGTTFDLAAGTHTLTVQARVTENEIAPGQPGGILQSAFNLSDTAGSLSWKDTEGGFLGAPDGLWDSTAPAAFDSHFRGTLTDAGRNIVAETGAVAPGNFTAKFNLLGAGVFSEVSTGSFTFNGTATTLNLVVANPAGGDILVAGLNGSTVAGVFPTTVNNVSVTIGGGGPVIPEPGTLAMAGMGLVGLVLRRRNG
jgi:hypothetical protein